MNTKPPRVKAKAAPKSELDWDHMAMEEWGCLLLELDNKDSLVKWFHDHLQSQYNETHARWFRIHATLSGIDSVINAVIGKLVLAGDIVGNKPLDSNTIVLARMIQVIVATNYIQALDQANRCIQRHDGDSYRSKHATEFKTRIQDTMSGYLHCVRDHKDPAEAKPLEDFNSMDSTRGLGY